MKPSDLSEFFSLLGKAKKEKEEEFDNLLKEADINLDDLFHNQTEHKFTHQRNRI